MGRDIASKVNLASVFKDTIWLSMHNLVSSGKRLLNLKLFNLLCPNIPWTNKKMSIFMG